MKRQYTEVAECDVSCEIAVGQASWAMDPNTKSVKFIWFDKNGKACRGGEVPVEALPQMMELAIKKGFLRISSRKCS